MHSMYTVAKDPDAAQTIGANSAATKRVCVNLGAAEEEDSDNEMDDDNNNGMYASSESAIACYIVHS